MREKGELNEIMETTSQYTNYGQSVKRQLSKERPAAKKLVDLALGSKEFDSSKQSKILQHSKVTFLD